MSELMEILGRLERIERRLDKIEIKSATIKNTDSANTSIRNYISEDSGDNPPTKKAVSVETLSRNPEVKRDYASALQQINDPRTEAEGRNLLGIIAVVCFALAALLLVKFSIASGWLTPMRQVLLALLIGLIFTFTGFFNVFADRRYMSQLPATGMIILNLAVYAGVFYHELFNPILGLFFVSVIGLWSLVLLQYLRRDLYAVLSVVGVFLGAAVFSGSFEHLSSWGLFLIIWSVAFGLFSIWSRRRSLLFIAGYLALGFFGLRAADVVASPGMAETPRLLIEVICVQCVMFFVYSLCTVLFSILHRIKMESTDSWFFFPLVLFFYGQIYYFTNIIGKNYALGFALGLSLILYMLYRIAKKVFSSELASRNFVFTTISLIILHAIYFVRFSDSERVTTVLICGFASVLIQPSRQAYQMSIGEKVTLGTSFLYSYLLVLSGYSTATSNLVGSLAFGILGILGFAKLSHGKLTGINSESLPGIVLSLGNIQVITSIWRMKDYISEAAIAPLWIVFAIGLLAWAALARNATIARQGLVTVCLSFLRFMIFHFIDLSIGMKIISLFVVGALVFVSGYLYRYALRRAAGEVRALV